MTSRGLYGEQRPIASRAAEQLGVRALLDDTARLEHDDPVGERDRRGAVRDHERRATFHHRRERRADLVLLRRVDRGGRVVEDQHRRVGEDRARDREPLTLAAGERVAALAEHRVVAERQRRDELVRAAEASRGLDVLA